MSALDCWLLAYTTSSSDYLFHYPLNISMSVSYHAYYLKREGAELSVPLQLLRGRIDIFMLPGALNYDELYVPA